MLEWIRQGGLPWGVGWAALYGCIYAALLAYALTGTVMFFVIFAVSEPRSAGQALLKAGRSRATLAFTGMFAFLGAIAGAFISAMPLHQR